MTTLTANAAAIPDVAPTAIRVAKPAPGVGARDAIELG